MSATEPEVVETSVALTEPERVFEWRLDAFVRLGVAGDVAIGLADSTVDVREFERLVVRGCCPVTAARILL